MAEEIFASVQVRRDNKANWEAVNPILLDGEAAYEKDTDMFKIGDGVNSYKNLPYHNKVGPKGDTGATPQISMSVSTGAAGSEASVSVSGTAENPLISLTIPRGDTGASGVTKETDPTVPDWAKQPNKPSYTAQEVGADSAGAASTQIATHNTNTSAHADIRTLISELTNRFNALADSDDNTLDQLSEIVAYIKSNKALIDAVTTGKVSTSDIVDNLTTNASGKVLSAAQGVALKGLIDAIVIPDKLPNPQPLTINGQSYDGSAAVEVSVKGEGSGVEVDNTLTQSGKAADAKVVGDQLSELNEANAAQDERLNTLEQAGGSPTDLVSSMTAFAGVYRGIDLNGFLSSVLKLKANPDEQLDISTYDGGNQPTHPKVLYFPDGWNGYKFWMAYTPWTNQNNGVENPCICYSNDAKTWISDGIENPLAYAPTEDSATVGYNSDVHLVMVGDVMECWWRTHYQSGSRSGYLTISRRMSTDGVTWTDAEELHETNDVISNLSPVVIYEDGVYKIWLCYGYQKVVYYESADGTNWQKIRDIFVSLTDKPNYKIWHFDIIHSEKHGYEFVGCYNPSDTTKNLYIYYAQSDDNVTYTTPYMVLTTGNDGNFDSGELYRPSLVRVGNGVMLFYGARKANTRTWAIGKIEATTTEALHNILVQAGETETSTVTTYSVTRNLTYVTSSNLAAEVEQGKSYTTTLEALSGYAIDTVTVTMGGEDVTSTAYSGSTVYISSVTGNIVITAVASVVSVEIPCTGIELDQTTLTFTASGTQTLMATVTPIDTTDVVVWSTDADDVATVSGGVVKAVGNGSATITATCGNYSATCSVSVSLPAADEPVAAYLASSPGSTENAWEDTKGGASMTLNGGTFVDGVYQADGIDDYAVLPLNNVKTMKMRVNPHKAGGPYYIFDCRTAASAYMLLYAQKDWAGTDATYYIDDTLVELGTYGSQKYLSVNTWYDITVVFNTAFTGNVIFFSSNKIVDFMNGELESVYLYDVEVLPS